jgi:hypothetical protein
MGALSLLTDGILWNPQQWSLQEIPRHLNIRHMLTNYKLPEHMHVVVLAQIADLVVIPEVEGLERFEKGAVEKL